MMTQTVTSPGGRAVAFSVRPGTNDDAMMVGLNNWDGHVVDEYRMTGRVLSGWAMDVGAHIGGVAIPLALDHPDLRVIAVEGVPGNAALLRENVARNGVADRVEVVEAFAAAPGTATGVCHYGYRHEASAGDSYVSAHRFVGNTWGFEGEAGDPEFSDTIDAVSLDDLLTRFHIKDLALLKIDCEGCEWAFLDTKAVSRVQTIVGEYHGRPKGHDNPVERLREMLPDHDVTPWSDEPVNGLFEAVRR
jgi:FkbM family methyltransferase